MLTKSNESYTDYRLSKMLKARGAESISYSTRTVQCEDGKCLILKATAEYGVEQGGLIETYEFWPRSLFEDGDKLPGKITDAVVRLGFRVNPLTGEVIPGKSMRWVSLSCEGYTADWQCSGDNRVYSPATSKEEAPEEASAE